ncbi:MAG TPA: acyl-CoA dehydrogenase [Planctomycetaceae bacterium]|jgi:alkylation response protein AidB-like acyl-CoA dehydrogenase|nr:acyl-CoA dehydrogenase [Planctomycetaceae bacterium]
MDLGLTPSELKFRDEFRAWLKVNMPKKSSHAVRTGESAAAYYQYLKDWQRKLFDGGYAGIAWPKEFGGRGATFIEQAIFQEELALADAPELGGTIGLSLVGPTIIAVGTEAQKQRYLPRMLSGEEIWCQGFSEPNAGSDLASLETKAVLDGDHFIVNGQKIWTSYAHIADLSMLVVRTDTTAPKHKGITCLLVDMKSPGISVRPLKMMSGDSAFNEMFFSNVRVPAERVLGKVNEGWNVAITALSNERANLGSGLYIVFKRNLDAVVEQARKLRRHGKPVIEDTVIRQKLAQAFVDLEVFRLNTTRALSNLSKRGVPGPEGSIQKLSWSELNQRNAQIAMEVLGSYGQLTNFDSGRWAYNYLRSRGNTIEAGTSEVQRNIIAQRVLGLPRSY